MRKLKRVGAALCLIAVSAVNSACAATAEIDKAGAEAADLLSHYLQIDTTNPPGNEQDGAEYLAGVLKKNGIESEIIKIAPRRACVYARLTGSGKKRPLVLLNHIDVVPAQAKDWKYPPFAGEVHDGELWGRGALDMKNMGIMQLVAMLMLKREGVKLDRDIIFLATPDEEVGGGFGAEWIKKNRPDVVKNAEFLLNEGCNIDIDKDGKMLYWGVDVAEKSVLWLKLTARGDAGHASMPNPNSAPNQLVRALTKLVNSPVEFKVLPVVQQFFADVAPTVRPELRDVYKDLSLMDKTPQLKRMVMQDKQRSAMLRNTVSLTVLKSGYKTNVIPGEATAELDCRLLPDVNPDEFTAEIQAKLGDPKIEISRLEWESAKPSPADTELFRAIKQVAAAENPATPVVPEVVGWFTDSHWFRDLGIISYGFEPVETDPEHMATVHGINERIPLKYLTNGTRRMHDILVNLCAAGK